MIIMMMMMIIIRHGEGERTTGLDNHHHRLHQVRNLILIEANHTNKSARISILQKLFIQIHISAAVKKTLPHSSSSSSSGISQVFQKRKKSVILFLYSLPDQILKNILKLRLQKPARAKSVQRQVSLSL